MSWEGWGNPSLDGKPPLWEMREQEEGVHIHPHSQQGVSGFEEILSACGLEAGRPSWSKSFQTSTRQAGDRKGQTHSAFFQLLYYMCNGKETRPTHHTPPSQSLHLVEEKNKKKTQKQKMILSQDDHAKPLSR